MLVTEAIKEQLIVLAEKYKIVLILLFGSQAKGNAGADSDLDLGVLFDGEPRDAASLFTELIAIFKRYTIDVVVLNHCDPVLGFEIISNYKILYSNNQEIFLEFYLKILKQYNDIQKLLKLEQIYLNNFVGGARSGIQQCDPPQIGKFD